MTILVKGLNTSEAVVINDASVLVALDRGTYEILQGESITEFTVTNWADQRVVPRESIDTMVKVHQIPPKVLFWYETANPTVKLTPEEFDAKRYQYYDREAEEYCYPSLEIEFKHRRLRDRLRLEYSPKYGENTVTKIPFPVSIIGTIQETGSEFIRSSLMVGERSWTNSSNVFMVETGKIARDQVAKLVSHYKLGDDLVLLKVHGQHVFLAMSNDSSKPWIKRSDANILAASLSDAQTQEADLRSFITKVIESCIKPVTALPTIGELTNSLYDAHAQASRARTRVEMGQVQAKLRKILDQLDSTDI